MPLTEVYGQRIFHQVKRDTSEKHLMNKWLEPQYEEWNDSVVKTTTNYSRINFVIIISDYFFFVKIEFSTV